MLFSSDPQSTRAAAALADVVTSDLSPEYGRRLNVEGQDIVPGMVALLGEEEASGVRCGSWRGSSPNIDTWKQDESSHQTACYQPRYCASCAMSVAHQSAALPAPHPAGVSSPAPSHLQPGCTSHGQAPVDCLTGPAVDWCLWTAEIFVIPL